MKPSISFLFAFAFAFLLHIDLNAQSKYETRTGKVTFQSKTAVEEFYSENNQVASILKNDRDKKIIAFNVIMRSFKFEKALMEEHFNEKYVHSEKYPTAKFIGEIKSTVDFTKPGVYKNIKIDGALTLHGATKSITIYADFEVKQNNEIKALSTFIINPEDYNIDIPKLVNEKVSKDILVTVDALYKQSK